MSLPERYENTIKIILHYQVTFVPFIAERNVEGEYTHNCCIEIRLTDLLAIGLL